jgi:hypothetical protein
MKFAVRVTYLDDPPAIFHIRCYPERLTRYRDSRGRKATCEPDEFITICSGLATPEEAAALYRRVEGEEPPWEYDREEIVRLWLQPLQRYRSGDTVWQLECFHGEAEYQRVKIKGRKKRVVKEIIREPSVLGAGVATIDELRSLFRHMSGQKPPW